MIHITSFKLNIDTGAMFSKALNVRLGNAVFVPGYRDRMRRGMGVDANGNPIRHKPLKRNARRGKSNRSTPLFDTGKMVRSFRVNRGRTTDRALIMDFPDKERRKAAMHQLGNRKVPARPHIGATRRDLKEAVRFLENYWRQNIDKFIQIG